MMTGGITSAKPATQEIQDICFKIQKRNVLYSYPMFKAIEYRSQIVAGVNYIIKVQVDQEGSCVFIKVYQSLPQYDKEKLDSMHLTSEEELAYMKSTQELTLVNIKEGFTLTSYLN